MRREHLVDLLVVCMALAAVTCGGRVEVPGQGSAGTGGDGGGGGVAGTGATGGSGGTSGWAGHPVGGGGWGATGGGPIGGGGWGATGGGPIGGGGWGATGGGPTGGGGWGGTGGYECPPVPPCNWCNGQGIYDIRGCLVGYQCANGADPCRTPPCKNNTTCPPGEGCGPDALCWPVGPPKCTGKMCGGLSGTCSCDWKCDNGSAYGYDCQTTGGGYSCDCRQNGKVVFGCGSMGGGGAGGSPCGGSACCGFPN